MTNVVPISDKNMKAGTLAQAIEDTVYERAEGMSLTEIIGALDIVKMKFFMDQMDDE